MAFPTGDETGTFLALDMGGTNLRVCEIVLTDQKSEFDIIQSKYRMPEELKTGESEELWEYIADCLQQFIESHHAGEKVDKFHLGFTFSYPATQNFIDHGILQRWTKGFDIDGVEGENVVPMLEAAIAKRASVSPKYENSANTCTGRTHQAHCLDQRYHWYFDCVRLHRHEDEDWVHLRDWMQRCVHGKCRVDSQAGPHEPAT
jgi:hypothetical protein